jgi:tellurite resistance protein
MSPSFFIGLFSALLLLSIPIGLWVWYWGTPQYRWKRATLGVESQLRYRVDSARRNIEEHRTSREIERLRGESLRRHFESISVDQLQDHDGIGPKTVELLRDTGHTNLAQMRNKSFDNIRTIGEARDQQIRTAVRRILEDAEEDFRNGRSRFYREFESRTAQIEADLAAKRAGFDRDRQTAEQILGRFSAVFDIAHRLTIPNVVLSRPVAGFTDELMKRDIPKEAAEFEKTMRQPATLPAPTAPKPIPLPTPPAPRNLDVIAHRVEAPRPRPPVVVATQPPGDLFLEEVKKGASSPVVPTAAPTDNRSHQQIEAACKLGFSVAKIDGRIANSEKQAIRDFLTARWPAAGPIIPSAMDRAEAQQPTVAQAVGEVKSAFAESDFPALLQLARDVADSAGTINEKERNALERIAAAFGLTLTIAEEEPQAPPVAVPEQTTAPAPIPTGMTPDQCRQTLEIAREVTLNVDLIRRQHRLLTERFDPAKFANAGADFVQVAEGKRAAVRTAALTLLTPFGADLEPPAAPPPPSDIRHNPDLDDVFGM